ncbi:hypothetical protein PRIPAC_90809 [Pristionchus pacificus]|uniref:DIX domain-containing protein n=1 Tax=Pristionchus pacificus TaxID=54126 RepID=A0A2A6CTI5_PRIPA|nr:hypothetical protein PRIPAC_90809 [Pristionchus pacificus]|eukprot:PDM81351.1 hypothetical protein PRIPAC_35227 [Pristionchus pacificus]
MPSHISSTPPPGGSSLDVSSATPSTVIDATGRLRLDDSLDSSIPYSPGCGLDTSSFNGTGALADSSAMSASPRGTNGDDPSSLLSSPSSSMASGREGRASGTGRGGHSTAFEKPISTKVFYNVDDEATPYVTQVDVPPEHVTLEDFKRVLTRTNYKFYCKTVDPECGVEVKKELLEDHKHLERSANGNFELYLVRTLLFLTVF